MHMAAEPSGNRIGKRADRGRRETRSIPCLRSLIAAVCRMESGKGVDGDHARTHTPSSHSTRLLFILRFLSSPTHHTHTHRAHFLVKQSSAPRAPTTRNLSSPRTVSTFVCLAFVFHQCLSVCVIVVPSSVFPLHEIDETTN